MTIYPAYDAGELPPYTAGEQSPLWWGIASLASMASILYAALIFSYFYLRMGQPVWPPGLLGAPGLVLPTIGSVLFWASAFTLWLAADAADRSAMWMLVSIVLACGFEALKIREMFFLPFGWDQHPYGSIFWLMNAFQFLKVAAIILWAIPVALFTSWGRLGRVRRAGVEALRIYWTTAAVWWVFFYLVLYYAPRVLSHVP